MPRPSATARPGAVKAVLVTSDAPDAEALREVAGRAAVRARVLLG